MLFKNRREAGKLLGQALVHYRHERPIILGLPRGGVVTAYEVAKALGSPLDVVVSRKIGAPGNPELAVGAIAPHETKIIDKQAVHMLGIDENTLNALLKLEYNELTRREKIFKVTQDLSCEDRTVIVVDDGLATGLTMQAALESLRKEGPKKIVMAVPVAAPNTVKSIKRSGAADEIICLEMPEPFIAVGAWYIDFPQLSDSETLAYLKKYTVGSWR